MHSLLLIDDNTAVQRMVELAFHNEPITIAVARTLDEALHLINEAPPDLILADEAFSIVPFLKNDPNLSAIPILILRGAFGPMDPPGEQTEVLKKPIHPEILLSRVKLRLGLPAERPPRQALMRPAEAASGMDHALPLDEYFDQLSAALSKVNSHPPPDIPPLEVSDEDWFPRPVEVRPALRQPSPEAALPISDELVDRIAQRVIEKMGDRMVRGTVTEIVSRLAKWLVADELERVEKKAKAR